MPILELNAVSKHFGAIHALNEVDMTLEAGEVFGPDGRQRRRQVDPGQGHRRQFSPDPWRDSPQRRGWCTFTSPVEAREKGVEVVYQDLALCNNLSAAANVFLGREIKRGAGPFRWLDHKAMAKRAGELFSELKSETRPRDLVRQMSGGQRQAVAIARTRLSEARLVLMDEPTAAISVRQVAEVLDLIRRLKDAGMAIILISHRMPDVFAVCDRVMVMRRGNKVADKSIEATSPEEVTGLITGAIHAA